MINEFNLKFISFFQHTSGTTDAQSQLKISTDKEIALVKQRCGENTDKVVQLLVAQSLKIEFNK